MRTGVSARAMERTAYLPKTQCCAVITAPGGPEVLRFKKGFPVAAPGPDEVLIHVAAAGVNRHDCNQRRRGPSPEHSDVPGLEVSGHIIDCGQNVSRERIGRPVMALTDGGGYGEYVVTHSALAFDCPRGLDLVSAASFPEALFTTWLNFFTLMRLEPGESALIHGGASGVGSIAIQVLRALGHAVFVTAGTEAKRNAALELGATAAFDYADEALAKRIKSAVGEKGIDAILDMSAGAHIEQDMQILAPDGRISFLSPGKSANLPMPLRLMMTKRIKLTGAMLRGYPLSGKIEIARKIQERALPLIGTRVFPKIDSIFSLTEADRAHARMESNAHIGKIVLRVDFQ
jgi:NADPH:quinone reductase